MIFVFTIGSFPPINRETGYSNVLVKPGTHLYLKYHKHHYHVKHLPNEPLRVVGKQVEAFLLHQVERRQQAIAVLCRDP